ncbi:hypothetical protein PCS_02271 [Desulfocurvibacter africanus PCS]|uniref:Lipoprotein n=1 Tax=Desulfocurvibacter africanus PCS TaxID=1262666 RepID=M5Q0S5_DESAF|nr:hypothetical protein [Desulfocurvibacter africanus]EMG36951.1 hypothetical protein PCS_02271 [Desulfocurvibacter africanus PCS]
MHRQRYASMLTFSFCLAALFLSACAKAPTYTREEWLAISTRHYIGSTPEQLLSAAEKVFLLADGSDFRITHQVSSMRAVRVEPWLFMKNEWDITCMPTETGTTVSVSMRNIATPYNVDAYPYPDAIDLFHTRLAYLLSGSGAWMTCPSYKAQFKAKHKRYPILESICAGAKDETPPASSKDQ